MSGMSRVREALERLDLHCANYVEEHRPGYDLCAKNRRPRGGPYGADQWCLECEVRAALLADTPSVEPAGVQTFTEDELATRLRPVLLNRGISGHFADALAAAVFAPGNAVADAALPTQASEGKEKP